MGVFPQVDYGQGSGAWVPAGLGEVYQAMEKARFNPAFARPFMADILFGREDSGNHYWSGDPPARHGLDWLYNENTLNASKTWVAAIFGPAATLVGGTWRKVGVLADGTDWGFIAETELDGHYLRMARGGNVAFQAVGVNGVAARVTFAEGYEPRKGGRARPESGNAKRRPYGRYYE